MDGAISSLEVERFRPFLLILAQVHLDHRLQAKVSPSDVVQQTLLEAVRDSPGFEGDIGQRVAWLRAILAHNISRTARDLQRDKRDFRREVSLERALEDSSCRLAEFIADSQTSPSGKAMKQEEVLRLSAGIFALPDSQREAILFHYLKDLSLPEIGEAMDRTPAAVAGLLRRGLARLRHLLAESKG